jgi:hypothetical protein
LELVFKVGDTVLGLFGILVDILEVLEPVVKVLGDVSSEGVYAVWQERGKRSGSHCVQRPIGYGAT